METCGPENQQPVWWHLPSATAVALMYSGMVLSLGWDTFPWHYFPHFYCDPQVMCYSCKYLLVFPPLVSSFTRLFRESWYLDEACIRDATELLRGQLLCGGSCLKPKMEEKTIHSLKASFKHDYKSVHNLRWFGLSEIQVVICATFDTAHSFEVKLLVEALFFFHTWFADISHHKLLVITVAAKPPAFTVQVCNTCFTKMGCSLLRQSFL